LDQLGAKGGTAADMMVSDSFKSIRMYEFAFPFSSLEKSAIILDPLGAADLSFRGFIIRVQQSLKRLNTLYCYRLKRKGIYQDKKSARHNWIV
jgi:hypothetical protein